MREIKFRGLRKEYDPEYKHDKWKYGNLLNECSIGEVGIGLACYTYAEVIPETVGEFTGLKDKNGKEIYENDLVVISTISMDVREIKYKHGSYLVCASFTEYYIDDFEKDEIEVIGNIYENPEPLKS